MSQIFNARSAASVNMDHSLNNREQVMDGLQSQIFRHRLRAARNLYQRDLTSHYGCINALEFSHGGQYLASGGDDRRVLLWNVDQTLANIGTPRAMQGEHASNIFCLGFDINNTYLFSGGNDEVVIQHDLYTGQNLNYFSHDGPVYGLSVDKTNPNLFSVATELGEILVYDLRVNKNDPFTVAKFRSAFNAVEFHPLNGNILATANAKRGAMLWDIRHQTQPLYQYYFIPESPSCMSARFNSSGSMLLTLHRRLPPTLYKLNASEPLCTFYHPEYFNSCTMKSCTFAGPDDELIVSGSDNFNMFIWRLDDIDLEQTGQWVDSPPLILVGHQSIVNQVRYNRQRCLLASSGVEKTVKLWSPFEQQGWQGSLLHKSAMSYCSRPLHRNSPEHVQQDFTSRNTEVDLVMLAFFDTLVQRELESMHTTPNGAQNNSTNSLTPSRDSSLFSGNSARTVDTPNVSEMSWQSHPNRIFYLISKKRRSLLHLALKSASAGNQIALHLRGKAPLPMGNLDLMVANMLAENKHVDTEDRITQWLEDMRRQESDDEQPTTSAEAAARERWRRSLWYTEPHPPSSPNSSSSPTKSANSSVFFSRHAQQQLERKRKLMLLRFAALKRRRAAPASRNRRRNNDDSDTESDSLEISSSSSSTSQDTNSETNSSSSDIEGVEPETNNNIELAANNNDKPNTALPMACNNESAGSAKPPTV